MYSMYDQYKDIMAGRISSFKYDGNEFSVYLHRFPGPIEVIYYNQETKERFRGFSMRGQMDCMTAFQGVAACLLHYKKDIWFDRHGELCEEKDFSQVITKAQSEEDYLDKLQRSVCDLDIDDRCPL